MVGMVLSECGVKPLPRFYPKPRTGLNPLAAACLMVPKLDLGCPSFSFKGGIKERNWALKVSAPARIQEIGEEGKSNGGLEGGEFDPAAPPPFKLADIKAAIPKHCWVKDPWKSMSYVLRDVVVVFGLAAAAAYFNHWAVWPLYWFAQGTMFWALFVLGHDCGHGSFSNDAKLNSVVGHILHSSILVPYHGWRISHRTHHQNHGHVENDESWHPIPEKIYNSLDAVSKKLRFTLPFPLLAYPFYLWVRSPGKKGSHYNPSGDLFLPQEKNDVITSTVCWTTMVGLLVGLSFVLGPVQMLKLYGIPYWTFVMWLDLVTYLHHHGHEDKLPWYRGKEWNYMRGGLTTLDRDYGWINNIHHDIGTHVIHHLFPQIPHYNLIEATEAAKPVLGKYYREPKKSWPLPFHLLGVLISSMKKDHFVSDTGDIVFYQTDPEFSGSKKSGLPKGRHAPKITRNVTASILDPSAGLSLDKTEVKETRPLVKMCGITSARDAALAAEAGADLIGMIIWPNSKRSIPLPVAKEISRVARLNGAKPVGVFVDDDAETILKAADAADLEFVQLHGSGSRSAFPTVMKVNRVIYVLHANEHGELLNPISDEESLAVDWILVDSATGGSGKGFDWSRFKLPSVRSKNGWLLAGGINPNNVSEAISMLRPHGVDVSSGICASDGISKDESKILSFMNAVRSSKF